MSESGWLYQVINQTQLNANTAGVGGCLVYELV